MATFCLSGRLLGCILVFWKDAGRQFACPGKHFACLGSCWESFWMDLSCTQHTAHRTQQRAESRVHTAQSREQKAQSTQQRAQSTEQPAKHTSHSRQQCTIETALLEQKHPLTGFVGPSCQNKIEPAEPEPPPAHSLGRVDEDVMGRSGQLVRPRQVNS